MERFGEEIQGNASNKPIVEAPSAPPVPIADAPLASGEGVSKQPGEVQRTNEGIVGDATMDKDANPAGRNNQFDPPGSRYDVPPLPSARRRGSVSDRRRNNLTNPERPGSSEITSEEPPLAKILAEKALALSGMAATTMANKTKEIASSVSPEKARRAGAAVAIAVPTAMAAARTARAVGRHFASPPQPPSIVERVTRTLPTIPGRIPPFNR